MGRGNEALGLLVLVLVLVRTDATSEGRGGQGKKNWVFVLVRWRGLVLLG